MVSSWSDVFDVHSAMQDTANLNVQGFDHAVENEVLTNPAFLMPFPNVTTVPAFLRGL